MGRRVRSFVRGKEPLLRTRKLIVSRSVQGEAPETQLHSTPIAVSGSGYTGNVINSLKLSSICKSASQAGLSSMQPTLHATRQTPHGASCLVQPMSAWSVKTRHVPSRHCRDARIYCHTTTTMHEIEHISPIEYTPPTPPAPLDCVPVLKRLGWRRLATTL